MARWITTLTPALLLPLLGCPSDDTTEENMLPSASQGMTDSPTTTATDSATTEPTSTTPPMTDSGSGGELPATFRFDCIDIQMLGDADGTVFQAQLLEDTWAADIMNYKLNIMLEVVDRDDMGGTANLGIRSGVGPDAANLCSEATTQTDTIVVDYTPGESQWGPSMGEGECSAAAAASEGGTYDMTLDGDTVVHLYAENDDTVPFNCTQDATPDAVPIRAIEAQVSTNAGETALYGTLTGCILGSEAMSLCSCLNTCPNNMGPGDLWEEGESDECVGCPTGSVPLSVLLGDIGTSERCTGLLGADAYDLLVGFTAERLPNVPATCG